MKILILGGSGHVSGTLARAAVAAGHQVWILSRGLRPVPAGVTPLVADRHDVEATAAAVDTAATAWDLVVDCICYDLPDMVQDIELFRRNRAGRFVFISTDFVYSPAQRRFPQPESPAVFVSEHETLQAYGWKKRRCELELLENSAGLDWTVLRPCHIYGPGSRLGCLPMHGRDPQLCERLRAGEELRLVGGGHFLQQPVLAADLAATILSAATAAGAPGGIFNVAGPDVIESRQYYQIIAEVLKVKAAIAELPVAAYLAEHPEAAPFLCHRINDLRALATAGLHVPDTAIEAGLEQHVRDLCPCAAHRQQL